MQDPNSSKRIPGSLSKFKRNDDFIDFYSDECILRINVISDYVIRFRYGPDNIFERDFSYAVDTENQPKSSEYELSNLKHEIMLSTQNLKCFIDKESFKVRIENNLGDVISEDEKGFHWEDFVAQGGNLVYYSRKIQIAEVFLGLGDKPTDTDLRGKVLCNWGSDMFGFEKDVDPLYKNIPFFIGLHNGLSYGIFLDNTFKTTFDFGHYNHKVMSFWADGGEFNYYFIYGPAIEDVCRRYVMLTGLPDMPPIWALGYHQSKWSYFPEQRVMDIAKSLREKQFPSDGIFLDIDYMEAYKCFTWDKLHFPNPHKMISELNQMGFNVINIIDPGIKVEEDYEIYEEGVANDYFCHRADGPLLKATVWPGVCNFPDFTNPIVRKWWSEKCQVLYNDGVAGLWNDMNEPAVFGLRTFPFDVRHNYEGDACSHRKAHNVYGMLMTRASYEGFKTAFPDKRPFMLTRSGYSGVQKYAAVWTGDNLSKWEHIWLANLQCQRLSISGLSFCGSDIGGFIGEANPELMCRWMQLAVFHPFMRAHSSSDSGDKEPWLFEEPYLSIIRSFIELRYQFLPYLYTAFWNYVSKGTPILKPILFADQHNLHTYYRKEEFLFGNHILACPIATEGAESRILFLPKGIWFDFLDTTVYEGNREIITYAPLDRCPMYIKAGTVLPLYPVIQHTGLIKNIEFLHLKVYFTINAVENELYEDAGEGYAYKSGEYAIKRFFTYTFGNIFSLEQSIEGNYQMHYSKYRIEIIGMPDIAKEIISDGIKISFENQDSRVFFNSDLTFSKINIMF
ncbi:MAG: glycoside hydrolase family 31 protein [Bacteroidota bacterium]|nr:glycoside hydrolase family 31 protein [Bacteroidota bacterium]